MSESPKAQCASSSPPTAHDGTFLVSHLAPALVQACDGRISPPVWFRAAWQSGGASTGQCTYTHPDGSTSEAIVKLPVGPNEYRWTTALGGSDCRCTPRVLAAGKQIADYDLAWLVVQKLPGDPLHTHLNQATVQDLLAAAVDWYIHAARVRPITKADHPRREDWRSRIAKAREIVHAGAVPEMQRWNEAIKHTQRILDRLIHCWDARPITTWCHGDLHPGNAMRSSSPPAPPNGCVLIDLALVHPGHWVEDAAYLERLYWAKAELLHGVKPVSYIAKLLRERAPECQHAHLLHHENAAQLAQVRRVLMAACVPAFLEHEGHPKYVHAALQVLERTLPQLSKTLGK